VFQPGSDFSLVYRFYYFYNANISENYVLYIASKIFNRRNSIELLVERHNILYKARSLHKQLEDYEEIYKCKGYFKTVEKVSKNDVLVT
jgi:hypothetical protein